MRTLRTLIRVGLLCALFAVAAAPAQATTTALTIHTRSCAYVTAYADYDGYSQGTAPFYAAFTVDLDNDGIFGEPGEPTNFVTLTEGGTTPIQASTRLRFRALKQGAPISVTVYETDAEGVLVNGPEEAVQYVCRNRPDTAPLQGNTGGATPNVAVVARVFVESIPVYAEPDASSKLLGGVGRDQAFFVQGRNSRGDFVKIDFPGGSGWIMWQTQARLLGPWATAPILEN